MAWICNGGMALLGAFRVAAMGFGPPSAHFTQQLWGSTYLWASWGWCKNFGSDLALRREVGFEVRNAANPRHTVV